MKAVFSAIGLWCKYLILRSKTKRTLKRENIYKAGTLIMEWENYLSRYVPHDDRPLTNRFYQIQKHIRALRELCPRLDAYTYTEKTSLWDKAKGIKGRQITKDYSKRNAIEDKFEELLPNNPDQGGTTSDYWKIQNLKDEVISEIEAERTVEEEKNSIGRFNSKVKRLFKRS